MKRTPGTNPMLFVPYLNKEERATSSRYRWNNWERGDSPYVILQWTLSGEGTLETPAGTFQVREDQALVVVVPERSSYYYPAKCRKPWVFSWLNLYGELACNTFGKFQEEFGPVLSLPRRSPAAAAWRRLIVLAENSKNPDRWQTSLQAYALILEWWKEMAQPPGRGGHGLEWVVQFCRGHFREPLAVKQLADECGMSREYFSRKFAAQMKETPAAFLRRLRLDEASTLLRETRMPLGEIAMRSGFYSGRHLMLTFQRVYGVNPSRRRD